MDEQERFDALEDILCAIEDGVKSEQDGFVVDCDEKAAWAGRKILKAEDRIARHKAEAARYKAKIDQWYERVIADDLRSVDYLRSILRPWVERAVLSLHKGKTVHLPGVSLALRYRPDTVAVLDENEALAYCERYFSDAVEVKKSLNKGLLKKSLADGMVIPGLALASGEEEMYLKSDETPNTVKKHHAA